MIHIILLSILPIFEMQTIDKVADEYRLNQDEKVLLIAIRKFENGRAGLEFGIGGSDKNHPAQRYSDGNRSFRVQCEWAAGTIKKRYHGDLMAFAKRYCPLNYKNWYKGVKRLMKW